MDGVTAWRERAHLAVVAAYGEESPNVQRFDSISYSLGARSSSTPAYRFDQAKMRGVDKAVAMLDAFVEDQGHTATDDRAQGRPSVMAASDQVFVVHGRDTGIRDRVARLLEKLELKALILEEQSDRGQTLIEKFERNALTVGFAVIILVADDLGRGPDDADWPAEPNRARQNVILELGYFMGRLGRERTAALSEQRTERPSDIHGMLYIPLDGNWELRLAKEMRDAGLPVDLNQL